MRESSMNYFLTEKKNHTKHVDLFTFSQARHFCKEIYLFKSLILTIVSKNANPAIKFDRKCYKFDPMTLLLKGINDATMTVQRVNSTNPSEENEYALLKYKYRDTNRLIGVDGWQIKDKLLEINP